MNSKKLLKKQDRLPVFFSRLLLSAGIFALLLAGIWFGAHVLDLYESSYQPIYNPIILTVQIALALISSLLLIILLAEYLKNLLRFKTRFTLAFVILAITLMAYSITSNPIFFSYFGHESMQGPFAIIPSIFTIVAVIALLYLDTQ